MPCQKFCFLFVSFYKLLSMSINFVYMLRKRYYAMLFHSYIHVTWLLSCQISGSKNTFFNSRPKYSRFACCRFSNLFKDHRQPKQEVQWLVLTELLFATRMSVVQSVRPEENAKKLALFSFSYWSSPRSLLRTHGRSSWSKSMYTVKTFNSLALICPAHVDPGPTLLSIMWREKRSFKPDKNKHNSLKEAREKSKKPCNVDPKISMKILFHYPLTFFFHLILRCKKSSPKNFSHQNEA